VNIEQAEVRLGHAMVPVRLEFGVAGVLRLLEIGVSIAEPVSTS